MHQLSVKDLGKTYATAAGPLSVLRDVQLSLKSGDAIAVTGPSGSGKSSLLYLLGLLDPPTAGTIEVDGKNPLQGSDLEKAAFRSEMVGFVFQDHHLLPQCTVLENVLIPTLALKQRSPDLRDEAISLLNRVGLGERLHHRSPQLSGGERQRVAVCRALINKPALLLADEPTGNLDRQTAKTIGSLLLEMAQERQSILVCVTHSTELAERFPVQYELRDGSLHRTN